MQITLKMGKNYQGLLTALRKAPAETQKVLEDGFNKALLSAAAEVKTAVGGGEFLGRRTGALMGAVTSYIEPSNKLIGYVGVGHAPPAVAPYAWLLGKDKKTITAKKQLLAIPILGGITSKGVARYDSPWDVKDGKWFKANGKVLFGRKVDGKMEILFVGKRSITVKGSGVLQETMNRHKPTMIKIMKQEVKKMTRKLGFGGKYGG